MSYRRLYIKSFGKTTKAQKQIIKDTLNYKRCELADEFENLKKIIWQEIKKIMGLKIRNEH